MTTAEFAAKTIAVFEGCELKAYQDQGGIWTIGYGHTRPAVEQGLVVTQDQAEALLISDIQKVLKLVEDKPTVVAAGYVSFGYNCGTGALEKVLAGEAKILDFYHIKGVPSLALLRRRQFEAALIEVGQQK